ncbi:ABC transporter ATP-binding protein [Candidatus Collierbacteria bacterium]|nr:ABC transporter ATP-binding protein [Candidatus Collierbacteria bacterium]
MFLRILALAKPYQGQLAAISTLILLISAFNQVEPQITKRITDLAVGGGLNSQLRIVYILLGILLGVKFLLTIFNRASWYMANLFSERFKAYLRQKGFENLLSLSIEYFDKQVSGKLMSQLDRGVARITSIINNSGMVFFPSLLTAVISIVIVMKVSPMLGIAAVASFIPCSLVNYWRFRKNENLEKSEYELNDNQYGHFWETISAIQLIKSFISEQFEFRRLKQFDRQIYSLRRQMERNTNIALVGDLFNEFWGWGMYAYIIWIAFTGSITIGTMILLIQYLQMIRQPLWNLNWLFWEAKRAQIGSKEFLEILEEKPEIIDSPKVVDPEQIRGRITFEKVSFTYDSGAKVFDNLSFIIKPGTSLAVVGPSGAGKLTLASLILRFYDPQKGRIMVDGIDIRNLPQRRLRKEIGFVMQDSFLFADTVEENLRYGKADASLKEMEQACRIANAHDFIIKLKQGYKTVIGERGVLLSGGQKQRLSLARTILKNPPIIILDEATSSLDSQSELYIQQALEHFLKGRTSLVIAHRLSTVQHADYIIVIKDRMILEQGSHFELLKAKGLYASLFKIQAGDVDKLREWDLVG